MKLATMIPIAAVSAETGEPIPDWDIELPRVLYVELRREARAAGQTFHDYFSEQLHVAFRLTREIRSREEVSK